jgi:formylglycine-generating enzyme required for sulfatase activity
MVDTDAGFCIDRIEVTQAAYDVFFQATAAMDASTPGPCAYKKTHDPSAPGAISTQYCSWNPATHGGRPVTCVDWCDAKAYCEWAGKRLCGRLGGGSVPFQQALEQDASVDEWDYACSAGGTRAFAYGNTFDSGACKDDGNGPADDAGSHPDCVGGFPGLFDMSGNALEWEDSCNGDASANDKCRARGGSWYFTSQANERCDAVPNGPNLYDLGRSERYDDTGFRCCKDAR